MLFGLSRFSNQLALRFSSGAVYHAVVPIPLNHIRMCKSTSCSRAV